MRHRERGSTETVAGIAVVLFVILAFAFGLWGCPQYKVYSQRMAGQAELRKQEFEKLILIEEANARLEAEKRNRLSEVERAKGVAEANAIIGDSLRGNEQYLRYLWIIGLKDESGERVYIPTEAGIPILEARPR